MRRRTCVFFLFLMASVMFVSAIPASDLPETAFNECETPVNQAAPIVPGTIVILVRPAIIPLVLHGRVGEMGRCIDPAKELRLGSSAVPRAQHSFQDLLCTFLI